MENIKEEPADTGADSMSSTSHEQYYSHVGDKAIKEENEPELENEANKDFRIMTVNDSVASRNLSDHEVRSLLQVWSDEKVSHQLKDSQVPAKIHISDQKMTYVPDKPPPGLPVTVTIGRMQDSERFINQHGDYQQEHHSFTTQLSQLQARCKRNGSLYSRSAKRCRSSSGKFRKVSKDIICLPAEYPEENCTYRVPRGKEREQLAMQGLVGKILIQSSWSFENFRSEVVSLFRKHFSCSDNEFSFNFLQCLPGNRKLIKPNVSASFKWSGIAIISLAAQGSLYIKTQHTLAAPAQNLFFNSKQRLPDVDSDGEHMNVRNASPSDIQKVEVSQRTAARLVNSSSPLNMENSQYCALKNFEAPLHSASIPGFSAETKSTTGMRLGEKRNQGKCEAMYEHPEHPGILLMPSKDHIATGNEARRDQLIGKASNMTTSCVLKLLQEAGIKTACVRKFSEKGFITSSCEIIPIEWVCWRMATGSYLKRHPDVEEGCRLSPPKVEMFSKRLLSLKSPGRVVVLMESISYLVHCDKIKVVCASYGIQCELRVTSADIAPEETLQIKSQYEGDDIPTVFITVASRSYGLASMLSANTAYPVINCPPVTADWSDRDVCSTLRTPENTRFCTVLSPQAAAQFAVHILGLSSHLLWAKLRSSTLNNWVSLKQADVKLRECTM
ncbi:uncharacterized protein LOC134925082 isoform X5 [Pseudophryne corroboree]|uniref:uncharacterized protein LOC134925082 isoform X5 n=1 Tax=Pseudophryne corroboree TaxID=495146 RepID=UPI003081F28A